jgi:transcriptional regulator with PAS, ATPase and Fis domain
MQIQLLRVLETKQLTRVGGSETIHSNFRIICATNRDLEAAVKDGTFREDLYYRLNVFSIMLPPLRERRADIPQLAQYFLKKYALAMHKSVTEIRPAALDSFVHYDWPGNVRELENVIERAMVLATPPAIQQADLPFHHAEHPKNLHDESLAAMESVYIESVLLHNQWNISQSAKLLDIDRVTLYNKIARYGLKKP